MIAQGAHASMAAVLINHGTEILATEAAVEWFANSYTKVGVSVNSEEELLAIHAKAKAANLPCSLIQDIGKTEFGGVPTYTAVAVGPAYSDDLDPITGNLKLL